MANKIPADFVPDQPGAGDGNYIDGSPTAAGLNQLVEWLNDIADYSNFFVGSTLDEPDVTVTSSGGTITASVEKLGGGDIRYKVNDETSKTLVCTPSPAEITLTAGLDTAEGQVTNYLYIDHSTGNLAVNTTGFPATPHSSIGEYYTRSATFHETRGFLGKAHRNHVFTPGDNGHMEHTNEARRKQHCVFENGLLLADSGSGTATVNFSISSGQLYRMHRHDVSGIASPAEFFINNDEISTDTIETNLHNVETYSDGSTNVNQYAVYVLFIAFHDDVTGLFLLKPSAGYNSESEALVDSDQTANWNIPKAYVGASIYAARVIARRTSSATTIYLVDTDVRSRTPGSIAGGGLAGVPDHSANHLPGGADELFNQSLNTTDPATFRNTVTAVSDDGSYASFIRYAYSDTAWHAPLTTNRRSRGTAVSKTAVESGDVLYNVETWGYDGGAWAKSGSVVTLVDGTVSSGIIPSKTQIKTANSSGTLVAGVTIDSEQNVGLGKNVTPTAAVHGKGSTSDSSAYAAKIDDSSGTMLFHLRCDGAWSLKDGTVGLSQTGYTTFTNLTTVRTLDANATTVEELADVLGTLIEDLKAKGIIKA